MAIDKSTRQHYATQGKVKNYLGKQKMVKAPKYWLSKPGHVKAKLAYITDAEEKILIDKNLYGSLRGRPNIGPAGLPSLQGGGGHAGGGGRNGGRNGGGPGPGGQGARGQATSNPGAPSGPGPGGQGARGQATQNPGTTGTTGTTGTGETAKEKAIRTAATTPKTKAPTKDRPTSFLGPEDIKQKKTTVKDAREEYISKTGERQKGITQEGGDGSVMEEVYGKPEEFTEDEIEKGITKYGKTIDYIGTTPVTDKRAKEFNLGLKERNIKTGEIQQGRNIINPYTQQLQSKFASIDTPKKGILGTLGNIALGILAPQLLGPKLGQLWSGYTQAKNLSKLASTFTGKDIVSDLTKNLRSNISTSNLIGKRSTTDTIDTRDDRDDRDREDGRSQALQKIAAPKDVITESVEKFSPRQMDLVRQRHEQLQQVIQTGMYNGQRLNNNQLASLQNASKQMEAFLVDPQKMMMMARGGLAGLNG